MSKRVRVRYCSLGLNINIPDTEDQFEGAPHGYPIGVPSVLLAQRRQLTCVRGMVR